MTHTTDSRTRSRTFPRRRAIGAFVAAGAALAATGPLSTGVWASGHPESGDSEFTVAAVLPSAVNDLAFSQSMVDSLERLKESGVIDDFATSENMFVVEDAATAIRSYAEDGYDLVIAHGSQYGGSLQEIAPDYPETAFAWGTAADTFGLDNVAGYTASADQGGYVMGAMGAMLAGDGSIGVIGPIEVGDGKLYVDGFEAGALSVNPDIGVGINYTESFSDTALAAEAATSFIDGGATVLSGTAQMTVGAIGVAQQRGVLWFGTNSNQAELAPDVVVASQVYHWEVVLEELINGIKEGDLGGDTYDINLANGGEVIEFNDEYDLPDEVRAAGDELIAQFAAGELESGVAGHAADATTDDTAADSTAPATTDG